MPSHAVVPETVSGNVKTALATTQEKADTLLETGGEVTPTLRSENRIIVNAQPKTYKEKLEFYRRRAANDSVWLEEFMAKVGGGSVDQGRQFIIDRYFGSQMAASRLNIEAASAQQLLENTDLIAKLNLMMKELGIDLERLNLERQRQAFGLNVKEFEGLTAYREATLYLDALAETRASEDHLSKQVEASRTSLIAQATADGIDLGNMAIVARRYEEKKHLEFNRAWDRWVVAAANALGEPYKVLPLAVGDPQGLFKLQTQREVPFPIYSPEEEKAETTGEPSTEGQGAPPKTTLEQLEEDLKKLGIK
jgi:hypothetical protein